MAVSTVLVLRALGLGDLLTGIPALRGIRRAYPDAHVVLATRAELAGLAMFTGAVDEVVPAPGLGELRWRKGSPDVAVNLHGSGPESIADLLATDPGTLITHRHADYPDIAGAPWCDDIHEVDRWCRLLEQHGIDCDAADLGIGRPAGYPPRPGVVVVHPGAAFAARRWPAERFAAVARELRAAGRRVVVTGSSAEIDLAHDVAHQAGIPESDVLAGQLDVLAMVAQIADCQLLICGDTGVGHIATATGTPSVLVFGPTPPSRWGPRGQGPHVTVWAGEGGDPHGDRPHPGLLLITAARVVEASRQMLAVTA